MNVRVSAIAADLYGKVKVLGATRLYITPRQERNEINEPNVKRDINKLPGEDGYVNIMKFRWYKWW